jgi:hyperosmotically inducible protein
MLPLSGFFIILSVMKRILFSFIVGVGVGAFGYWYVMEDVGRGRVKETRDQFKAEAGRVAGDLKTRIGELSEGGVEAVKEELARTGTVVREKARAAGQSIADTAANARTTGAVKARLVAEKGVPAFSINVDTTDGLVTLSGKVETPEQVARALQIALETDGVRKVISTLQLSGVKN